MIWTTLSQENYRYQIVSCQGICHRGAISLQNKSQSQTCHRLLFQEFCTNTKAQKVRIQAQILKYRTSEFKHHITRHPFCKSDALCQAYHMITNAFLMFKVLYMKHDKNTQHNLHYIALCCLLSFTKAHIPTHTPSLHPSLSQSPPPPSPNTKGAGKEVNHFIL